MSTALKIFDESGTQPELPLSAANSGLTATPIPGSPHPLVFDRAAHEYRYAGRKMKGVSSLISLFKRPFDSAYWSKYKADKANVSQQQILDEWAAKRDAACDLGHRVHEFAEMRAFFGEYQPEGVLAGYEAGINAAYRDLAIQPIEPEKPVCDPSIGIAGTVDLICKIDPISEKGLPHNAILDWKTNATISMSSKYGDTMLPPLSHLDDCSFNHYALQLNLYRFILARRYDFHAERLCLVWLPGDSTYQLIDIPILETEVAVMLSAWQRNGGQ